MSRKIVLLNLDSTILYFIALNKMNLIIKLSNVNIFLSINLYIIDCGSHF